MIWVCAPCLWSQVGSFYLKQLQGTPAFEEGCAWCGVRSSYDHALPAWLGPELVGVIETDWKGVPL